jgi:hypothetical protein
VAEESIPCRYRWRCLTCDASGEIPFAAFMARKGELKWGPAMLDEIMSAHDQQSPGCSISDFDLSLLPDED